MKSFVFNPVMKLLFKFSTVVVEGMSEGTSVKSVHVRVHVVADTRETESIRMAATVKNTIFIGTYEKQYCEACFGKC